MPTGNPNDHTHTSATIDPNWYIGTDPNWSTTTPGDWYITAADTNWYHWGHPVPPVTLEDDLGHPCLVFRDKDSKVIGRLWLDKKNPTFLGGANESTKLFLDSMKSVVDQYLRQQREKMITDLAKDITTASKSLDFFNKERAGAMETIMTTIREFLLVLKGKPI